MRVVAGAVVLACALATALPVSADAVRFQGRPLAEVLQVLRSRGLRIVFSSEIVTPAMRVAAEPRSDRDRQRLDEILAPHGLRVRAGPGGTLLIVRAEQPRIPPKRRSVPTVASPDAVYREEIRVDGSHEHRHEAGVGFQAVLGREELDGLRTTVADDPLRSAHVLPHVAAADDFRSEFSLRGSPYRHIGVVIDGVATQRLRHTAYGRGNAGSMSMLQGGLLDAATLQAGAYPQRFGSALGGQLGLTMREGSRQTRAFTVGFNASSASAIGEGPVNGGAGSWIAGVRQSYRNWPTRGLGGFDGTMFGFSDAMAKVVYDVATRHQLSVSMLGGQSYVDEKDGGALDQPGDGANRSALLNVALRSALDSRTVVTQRGYFIGHAFLNKTEDGHRYSAGAESEIGYRADVARQLARGVIESGGEVQNLRSSYAAAWTGAAYAHYRWQPNARVTISPGFRVSHSNLSRETPVGRWVLGQFAVVRDVNVNLSAGTSYQFPWREQAISGAAPLAPEKATYFDAGVGQTVGAGYRWQATMYSRRERDVLRDPRAMYDTWENALRGTSRGVEVMLERRRRTGVSGWLAYSYGRTKYTDLARAETFWADFDQRHALNLYGAYRLSDRSTLAVTFRSGTNFPIPGYLDARSGALFAGDRRNEVRLRPYARLDLRAHRSFERASHRLTLYAEVLNIFNRGNVGLANGRFTTTGEAIGFTQHLMPRLPSAGVVVEF